MKKLWVNWLLLFISMATAEKSNDTIRNLTGDEVNCTTREYEKDNLEFELTILNNMNGSADPCDNFYEFACGNFDNVPDDIVQGTQHNTFLQAVTDMFEKMFNIVTKSNSSESFKPFNFPKDFLISCIRLSDNNNLTHPAIKRDNLDYLKEIISKFGGWPVLEGHKWNETNDNWTNYMDEAKTTDFIKYHFYGLRSGPIQNYTITFIRPIDVESFEKNLTHEFFQTMVPYQNFMVGVANLLGANKTQAKEELAQSLAFEMELTRISMQIFALLASNKVDFIEFSVKEVIEKWPSIDWTKFFTTQPDLPSNITNETTIIIANTDAVTTLDKLIERTPARVRANYAMWKTIQKLIPMVESASLARLFQNYSKIQNASYVYEPFECYDELKKNFPELMIAFYGRSYPIDRRAKIHINRFISYIEQRFFDTLNSTKWLDVKTRDELFKRLKSLKIIIGYPDEIMDDRELKEYFQGLNITKDDFLKNVVNHKIFNEKKKFALKHKPQNSIGFMDNFDSLDVFIADASFDNKTKTLVLGVELVRNLFFSIHRPNYINLALLGDKLAHEIGHSIDYSFLDAFYSKVNDRKWSELSKQKYYDTRECIAQQYSNYSGKVTGKKVNGKFYVIENIADNIGVQVAYSAYQDWVKTHGPQPTFSSLPYNSNQLFWLSFANQWCSPKSSLQNWNPKDIHPQMDHRVIMPLLNSPEFSKDFNCPLGSNMNPVKKCSVF